jgi:hypothetical protein
MSTDALPLPDLATLPDDPATLRQLALQPLEALHGKETELGNLQNHMDLLLRRLYGRSSEKTDPWQPLLFDVASQEVASEQEAVTSEVAAVVEPETMPARGPDMLDDRSPTI